MEIGEDDVVVDFGRFVWGNCGEKNEDPLLEKASLLKKTCRSAMELNGQYAYASKTDLYKLSKSSLPIADGSWKGEVNTNKDNDGNKSVGIEGSIGHKSDSGVDTFFSGGANISSDKNQNIEGNFHGSLSIERKTEGGVNVYGDVKGNISTDGKSNFSARLGAEAEF